MAAPVPPTRRVAPGLEAAVAAELAPLLGPRAALGRLLRRLRPDRMEALFLLGPPTLLALFAALIPPPNPVRDHAAEALLAALVWMAGCGWFLATVPRLAEDRADRLDLLGRLARALGLAYHPDAEGFPVEAFVANGLIGDPRLPRPDGRHLIIEDGFFGRRRGVGFAVAEGRVVGWRLHRLRGWRNLVLLRVVLPRRVEGRTLVASVEGLEERLARVLRPGAPRLPVGLADPRFGSVLAAYGTDQVAGRVVLDPVMIERLSGLAERFAGARIQALFAGDELLFTAEVPQGRLAAGVFGARRRVAQLMAELGIAAELIDALDVTAAPNPPGGRSAVPGVQQRPA
jgi:hypothetical protein